MKAILKNRRRVLRSALKVLRDMGLPHKDIGDASVSLSKDIAKIERDDIIQYVTNVESDGPAELYIADIRRILQ